MKINPIGKQYNTGFGHGSDELFSGNGYSSKDRAIVAATTAFGVAASCAILAKGAGYSLKPSKMFKNIKNSYLSKVEFLAKPIIGIGAGSCLGGLAGGYIIDKDSENRKAKRRETVMQIGNISIPILTVKYFNEIFEKYGKKAASAASIAGVFVGVFIANFLMNNLGNVIFNDKSGARKVKATDFSAHVDDMLAAATYISKDKIVHNIARIVPVALMIPGNEVGLKKK